ncbi:hypothetical protein GYMLUDRAFT_65210 [Collybiopsis luxurians FD-317 M1]|uniref:Uncharacterized protein n=1 Tax=Collybiopsis luxurians FD-317 M1 TaxID=944289 RepID=A0A0D0BMA9_9AGAR|nr:hypothetical protein GYMLUDRAFT_65210 [Collybiopsis luxurians FD-317 M1]
MKMEQQSGGNVNLNGKIFPSPEPMATGSILKLKHCGVAVFIMDKIVSMNIESYWRVVPVRTKSNNNNQDLYKSLEALFICHEITVNRTNTAFCCRQCMQQLKYTSLFIGPECPEFESAQHLILHPKSANPTMSKMRCSIVLAFMVK